MGTNTKKDILLTITMLVSNRPDTTEKCLASMQPLLNAIPSELIVVDTAGNEECMEIVKNIQIRLYILNGTMILLLQEMQVSEKPKASG